MHYSIKSKLLLGYGAVLVTVAITSAVIYGFVNSVESTQTRISELRQPTVVAGMNLSNGVNITLAGLRGYMILGDDPNKAQLFQNARLQGWQLMDDSLKQFTEFSKNWTEDTNKNRLNKMKILVEEFRQAQEEIEEISQSENNIPSLVVYNKELKGAAELHQEQIRKLIEQAYQATPGKKNMLFLSKMSDSFLRSQVSLLSYINTGAAEDLSAYKQHWNQNQADFKLSQPLTIVSSPLWQAFDKSRQQFHRSALKAIELRGKEDWNIANFWLGKKAAPRAIAIQEILTEMSNSQAKLMYADNQSLSSDIKASTIAIVIGSSIAIVLGVFIALVISSKIVNNLKLILARTRSIAEGKLSNEPIEIDSNDELQELGHATTTMTENLCDLIQQVQAASTDLSSAASELIASSEETSKSMQTQRNNGAQVESAMVEMTTTVNYMANDANQAAQATQQADDEATEGQEIMAINMESIHQLEGRIESAAKTINSLEADTQGVDDIVQVINAIAEQTNLLALNAAIEAARAGDQGRGFAVVADEVRTLAGRTQDSTEEISTLLDKLKNGTQKAVRAMKEGQEQTRASVDSAQRTSAKLENISSSVATVHSMNSSIATAATEQHSVAETMNHSISEIQNQSQQALRRTEETNSAAQQVGDHAKKLDHLISRFTLTAS